MRRHVECQAVRTVEMRRPGGRDGPQRSLVTEERREEGMSGGLGLSLRDILMVKRRRIGLVAEGLLDFSGWGIGKLELRSDVLLLLCISAG
ncbi:hypothetical protein TorRG33x02_266840 [Trema orientale]|uniref:Uncharacterized protein n=1 Tax=Trema orientale TaxID=63057 RepID=A0A2P5D0J8_TREOI|nr:hypothetical protein TorRG33x02_266840 [Trema orientale]